MLCPKAGIVIRSCNPRQISEWCEEFCISEWAIVPCEFIENGYVVYFLFPGDTFMFSSAFHTEIQLASEEKASM